MRGARDSQSVWFAAVAVGVLSFAIGVVDLGSKSLWWDEIFDAVASRGSFAEIARLATETEMSQSAYLVFLKAWATVTPETEWWLRLPSVVFAALAAALLVPLGARLFDRTTGIVAGTLLATNWFVLQHAQEVRTYALATLAVVVTSLLLVRALDDPRRLNWLLYAAVAAAAVYCHFFAGLVVVAQVTSLVIAPVRPPRRRLLEAGSLFLVLIVPAAYFTLSASRAGVAWIPEPSWQVVRTVVESNSGRNHWLTAAATLGLVLLAFPTGGRTRESRWRFSLVAGWCLLPIALGFAISLVQPILFDRYAIVIAPGIALAAASGIVAAARWNRAVAVVAFVVVIATAGQEIARWYGSVLEDWRGAAAYIERERRPGDTVVVAPSWARGGYRYYATGTQRIERGAGDRRTLIVLYGDPQKRADLADALVDRNELERVRETAFGWPLTVRVYEPRR